ncbi:ABC transporter ATP-binding protein [Niabella ginsenosidivorans]|uniref:ABC transporter ATP-binding protein n=1 Tax=Niabella ginsenosidivorans TaxID=1176587 RepID=A0A1A9HZQ0_9BACT|nr:ABC-F family ATP-binding cassette domain-containing protein [Niabella ginsenosidivorans]ANH80856.1 ABC transporter ATP-binding protein [Niabella ginsenosidivorans]
MLVGLQNVTFEFGARIIVQDATWHIQPNERIGLIGYNGTGKSTLLKVLVGQYTPSAGTVERGRETTIGYLHQDLLSFDTNESILQVAMSAFEKVLQLEKEIEVLGKELEQTGDEKTLLEYTDKLHELELLGGYNIQHKTEEVLQGLGFANADLNRPYKEFSGGWRMRVLLAKMILAQPDLLLLDEPTNHLDLPSIEWLEKYLQHYQGAVVIVSHDKYFLNRMVTKIVELYQRQLHFYNGNYEFYEKEKAVRIEMQQKAYENQQDYIKQNERLVERFRAKASKAAMAQSIIKKLDKLERIEDVAIERPDLRINFRVDKVPGRMIVELDHLSKAFGDNAILKNAAAGIERGDKIALIGANGKGKSTLLRIIADAESFTGNRKWGHNVEESFYAQHQLEALNLNNTILDEMRECGSQMTDLELRALLGCFLFSGDDADKKIKILSGGEKARVALAKTIISRANFLMLDEPTNHLDMHSVDLLISALNRYEGTLILVSHDRHFIAKTANKIWEIVDGQIKEFKGPYDEWVAWNERMKKNNAGKKEEATRPEVQQRQPQEKAITIPAPPPAVNGPVNKELKKEIQRHQKLFQQAEEALNKNKERMLTLEKDLADPELYSNKDRFLKTEQEYKNAVTENHQLEKKYEELFTKLMELEEKAL